MMRCVSNTPSQRELLRLLAGVVSGQVDPAAVPAESWDLLADLSIEHGLGPMLLWSVKQAGVDSVPAGSLGVLAASAHQSAMADILYEQSLDAISRALASAGIQALWLKGACLARTLYPQSSLRPMSDLDVLVRRGQVENALDVLRGLGYGFDGERGFRPSSPSETDEAYLKHLSFHHYVLKGGVHRAVTVELHFGLPAHAPGKKGLLPEEHMKWFRENTRPFRTACGAVCSGLAPEAHLQFLAAHNILHHGEFRPYLMRDLDVHLLISRESLDWQKIVDQAVELAWTGAVARSLERSVELFRSPVPAKVIEELALRRPAHEDPALASRARVPGHRWMRVRSLLERLPAREKMRYCLQSLFPAVGYMRSRYAVSEGSPVWPWYAYRWFDQGREIIHALEKRRVRS